MEKLKDFGPVYLINLKGHKARLEHAKKEFAKHNIKNYSVIEAIDGRNSDLSDIIVDKYPSLKSSEIGCITSHIKAMKHWIDTSDSEYAIIMEDDFSFDTVQYWQWDWNYVVKNIPKDAEIVQLIMIKNDPVTFSLHKKEPFNRKNIMNYEWSTACYLIKRQYAKSLINLHYKNGKYKLDNFGYTNQAADVILYSLGNTYSMPLFTHILDSKNSINSQHAQFHNKSKNSIDLWWKNKSNNYSKEEFFNLKNAITSDQTTNNGCFTIFHEVSTKKEMKDRNNLVKKATEQLQKDFDILETPTIIMKTQKDVKDFYPYADIEIDPLGHFKTGWKPGELGIWASNYMAWKNFLKTDYDFLILMEDDIVLDSNFNDKLNKYIKELPKNWDVFTVYIPEDGNIRYDKKKNDLLIGSDNICKVYQSWSCLCYVVSRSGAKNILKLIKNRVKSPLDHYLFYHKSLQVYTIRKEKGNICSLFETKSTVQEAERYDMTGYV